MSQNIALLNKNHAHCFQTSLFFCQAATNYYKMLKMNHTLCLVAVCQYTLLHLKGITSQNDSWFISLCHLQLIKKMICMI